MEFYIAEMSVENPVPRYLSAPVRQYRKISPALNVLRFVLPETDSVFLYFQTL